MATIDQVIDTIPDAGHRGVDARTLFVTKQEAFQDALTDVFVPQINTFKTEANLLASEVNTLRDGTLALRNETENIRTLANTQTQAQVALATTQAGIATTKASEASSSANQALTYKNQIQGYVIPAGTSYSVDQSNTQNSAMTKAQFNALAEERKANRAGSGFDEMGKHNSVVATYPNINEGMWSWLTPNSLILGKDSAQNAGISKTLFPVINVNGVINKLFALNSNSSYCNIILPTAPNIYPYDTVLTAEQIASGVIKHADASNSGLVVNGKFDVDTSGWIKAPNYDSTAVINNGKLRVTATGPYGRYLQPIPTIVGKTYIVNGEATLISGLGGASINLTNSGGSDITVNVKTFVATTSTSYISCALTSTGAIGEFDNIEVYPADAISRSDLSMAESFHEDIAEKGFGYPLGNTQYLGGNTDGLTGIVNGAFTGFETYSLFGNFQAPSALIGKGYVWSSLTEAQRKAFIANPENNCYLDGDKAIQVRYRIRVVQGGGDSWFNVDPQAVASLAYNTTLYVQSKGKNSNISSDLSVGTSYFNSGKNNIGESGVWIASNTSHGYEGKCYALPIALVHRRNQGMYHPVYNPNGSKKASDGNFWYNTAISFTSISDCFDPAKLLTASGYIGTVSGRPDGLFYDQVHEGDILDLRNSSKKVEDYNRLISREFNKLVAGTTRGKEGELNFMPITIISLTNYTLEKRVRVVSQSNSIVNFGDNVILTCYKDGVTYYLKGFVSSKYSTNEFSIYYGENNQSTVVTSGVFPYNAVVPVQSGSISLASTRTKSNTLLHCDIIGNPANYPTSWKQSGVFGTPLIIAEDGTSLLPDGVKDTFKLSRKANATPLLCLRSTDNGVTWTSFTPTFSTATNAITLTDEPAGNLVVIYYQTHTSMAAPVINSEVLEIGDVYSFQQADVFISNDLIGKVHTQGILTSTYGKSTYKFTKAPTVDGALKKMLYSGYYGYNPEHLAITQYYTSNPAVKVFPYLTRLNGKAYLNLVFKEMKYGSYLAPTTVTVASATYTQNLTYKINIAGCALDGKVIKWIGTTTTSAIDWSLYDVSPTGVIYLLSTGVVYANAKLYDGDSWGDDSKFNIVDNVSTTTDDNGQTVLIGQKTVELPYFIDAGE